MQNNNNKYNNNNNNNNNVTNQYILNKVKLTNYNNTNQKYSLQ